jgi:hypothetical protein
MLLGDAEIDQVQIDDWDEKAMEDEVAAKEEEVARV